MASGGGLRSPPGPLPGFPWQLAIRAAAIVVGLTLLLIVDVRDGVFYIAWSLIVLALLSEAAATLRYWRRFRASRTPRER